jgi:nucleoside-specific outer membrane channel protein Tsx
MHHSWDFAYKRSLGIISDISFDWGSVFKLNVWKSLTWSNSVENSKKNDAFPIIICYGAIILRIRQKDDVFDILFFIDSTIIDG